MTAAMCRRGCLERPDRQEDLRRYVADQSLRRNVFRLEVEPILLPATMVPVDQLPSDHRARRYIEDRGFDPAELAAKWQVGYCDRCISAKPDIRDRIVVPVYGAPGFIDPNPRLAGWLARAVEESGGAPKYLNAQGFKKSKLVYRAPVFGRSDALVVVEGCTDAWRVGVHAVAVLGKKISAAQRFAIRTLAVGRPIVLMLDADAAREAGQARRELLAERRHDGGDVRVLLATLPPGRKDPGECTRAELEEVLAVALSGSPCHA
jgi:DNA primase